MIKKEIYNYSKQELIDYLRHEAGSSNQDYFHAKKTGGLKLQQVPEEYAELLLALKGYGAESYLSLGVGNGGSFAMECFFMQKSLTNAIEIDNLAYGAQIGQNEKEILDFIEIARPFMNKDCNLQFYKQTTDVYFNQLSKTAKFDVIFIDADHSYEGVKKDYDNSLNHINKGGLIIFHDVNSDACPGIKRIWSDVKKQYRHWEFIHSKTCGIGVIQI
ncbi:MAG: class I SAM-dependent methyltransferase [Bacteroidota bacterium]